MSSLTGPVLAEYQDLFSSTTTQGGPNGGLNLGAKAYTGDGREYRFVLAGGTTLVPGKLQQAPAETTGWEDLAIAAAAIGATSITTTSTVTVTKDAWAGGYVSIATTPGQGYFYKIKSNPAATAAVVTIQLEDPIQQVALTTGTKITVNASPYSGVVVAPVAGSLTGAVVGGAIFPITNAQYGWIQTNGACNLLADDAVTVGLYVTPSDVVGGAVTTGAITANAPTVGTAMNGILDTEYGPILLNIA